MAERKKTQRIKMESGQTVYAAVSEKRQKVPAYCKKNGKVCAFRLRISGMNLDHRDDTVNTACGYMYFTGKQRECEARKCDKFATKLPEELYVDFCDEAEELYEHGIDA